MRIEITENQLQRAKDLYDFNNIKNSISEGKSQIYGAIGEIILLDYFCSLNLDTEYVGCKDYDLICEGLKIDVKTKKQKNPPNLTQNVSIPDVSKRQKTDIYFWLTITDDQKTAYLNGWLSKGDFFDISKLTLKGEIDYPTDFVFKTDTWSTKISTINTTQELITKLVTNKNNINMSATKKAFQETQEQELNNMINETPKKSNGVLKETPSLFRSLAKFQNEIPVIHKATQGYGYTYADLSKIIQTINPILYRNNLGYTQPLVGNAIKTIIFHIETGETLESVVNIPQGVILKGQNDFQILGSAISYLRRYSLASILTLVTDSDLDATGEQVKKPIEVAVAPAQQTKKTINDSDFLKLCGAINGKKEHNGIIIDEAYSVKMYDLTSEQLQTIKMLNN